MSDEADAVLEAAAALRASGVTVVPIGDEPDRWQIGDLTFTDADVWRLAASRGLVEADEPR